MKCLLYVLSVEMDKKKREDWQKEEIALLNMYLLIDIIGPANGFIKKQAGSRFIKMGKLVNNNCFAGWIQNINDRTTVCSVKAGKKSSSFNKIVGMLQKERMKKEKINGQRRRMGKQEGKCVG